ncbi:unnamed protein product [Schistosoma mattheei]|uniref:Uncharacterized protein n=1 Tax=Schistosoma mattheei TaxID=31246 RepID=A0A183PGV2_9TREM|nr:unnamed protein product [Schistosoma mattheei]
MSDLAPLILPYIQAAHADLPIDVTQRTTEAIRIAIRKIKFGKVAGSDITPAEVLKSDSEVTTNTLHVLFKKVWQ